MLHRIPFPTRRLLAALTVAIMAGLALPILAQGAGPNADLAADGPDVAGVAARAADDGDGPDIDGPDIVGPGIDGPDIDGPEGEPGIPARLARRLELTDAQQDAIAKILDAGRARDLPLRKQARLVRHDLQGEMMKDAPAEKTVLALAKQANDLRGQLQAGRLLDRLAVRKVLTEEQRDKLMTARGRFGGFGPGGFGPGRFGPGGPGGAFMRGERGEGRHGRDGGVWERGAGRRAHRQPSARDTE